MNPNQFDIDIKNLVPLKMQFTRPSIIYSVTSLRINFVFWLFFCDFVAGEILRKYLRNFRDFAFFAIKICVESIHPVSVASIRLIIGAFVLFLYFAI